MSKFYAGDRVCYADHGLRVHGTVDRYNSLGDVVMRQYNGNYLTAPESCFELADPEMPFLPNADVVIQREMPKRETDPTGREASTPGAKLDAGKVRPDLILSGMPRALLAVAEVGAFGANKYTENGWMSVPDGAKRYTAAMDRHRLKETLEDVDGDSGLLHQAHLAWNALARLELALIELEEKNHA